MDEEASGSRRAAVIAVVVVVLLVLGGWWLTGRLHSMASLQDCVASGRTNCAPIPAPR
ncbi:MAG: hypothetical protein JO264_18620 [Acidisphaera sp.]|nr:hypothetical protein [Acidisphaera sp.]